VPSTSFRRSPGRVGHPTVLSGSYSVSVASRSWGSWWALDVMYEQWGATSANVLIGVLSGGIDNIPLMFAVPHHGPSHVGRPVAAGHTLRPVRRSSLLSDRAAAGVALMDSHVDVYLLTVTLKWTPAIGLGYA